MNRCTWLYREYINNPDSYTPALSRVCLLGRCLRVGWFGGGSFGEALPDGAGVAGDELLSLGSGCGVLSGVVCSGFGAGVVGAVVLSLGVGVGWTCCWLP